jgi:hypothetical protein
MVQCQFKVIVARSVNNALGLLYNYNRLLLRCKFKSRCVKRAFGRLSNITVGQPLPLVVALMPHPGALCWNVVGVLACKLVRKLTSSLTRGNSYIILCTTVPLPALGKLYLWHSVLTS